MDQVGHKFSNAQDELVTKLPPHRLRPSGDIQTHILRGFAAVPFRGAVGSGHGSVLHRHEGRAEELAAHDLEFVVGDRVVQVGEGGDLFFDLFGVNSSRSK